ncbi:MAG: WD40 repeat domain-containing protein, partial [Anaerolineae bacterium]|nr:WD40 repeat domain-containing protein [Anaerolineae bacterium]
YILLGVFICVQPFNSFAQDARGNLVGYIAADSAINVRSRPNGAVVSSLGANQSVTVLEISEDGEWVSVGLGDGTSGWVSASFVRVMESAIPADLMPITPENAAQLENITQIASLNSSGFAFSPDGRLIASYSWEGDIQIIDVRTKTLVTELTKHSDMVSDAAFSPDGSELASASWDGSVKIWNTQTWGVRADLQGHTDRVNSVAYRPDGTLLASVSEDGLLNVWNVETGERLHMIETGNRRFQSVAFSPDGTRMAAAADNVKSEVRVWDAATGEELWRKTPGGDVQIAFAPAGDILLVANGGAPGLAGYSVESGQQTYTISGMSGHIGSVAVNPAGTVVAAGTWSGLFMVGDIANHRVLFSDSSLDDAPDASIFLAFSPDGRYLMTSDRDHVIAIWGVRGSG